jgi:hypothetical protein
VKHEGRLSIEEMAAKDLGWRLYEENKRKRAANRLYGLPLWDRLNADRI